MARKKSNESLIYDQVKRLETRRNKIEGIIKFHEKKLLEDGLFDDVDNRKKNPSLKIISESIPILALYTKEILELYILIDSKDEKLHEIQQKTDADSDLFEGI